MKYYYDCEFIEDGRTIDLISIGIVAEDGREYYSVASDAPWEKIAKRRWLCENVVPNLPLKGNKRVPQAVANRGRWLFTIDEDDVCVKPRRVIANEAREFLLSPNEPVELWAYYGAYDHVVMSWLWGPMVNRPKGIPMFSFDLMQFAASLGLDDSTFPRQTGALHNALEDARWTRDAWRYLHEHGARFAPDIQEAGA